jgi:hypothetical protein
MKKSHWNLVFVAVTSLWWVGCASDSQNNNMSTEAAPQEATQDDAIEEESNDAEVALPDHLIENTFTLNGGGSVSFNFIGGRTSGNIRISGGRADLMGTFQIASADMVEVRDLKAVSGMFDASNNSGTFGSLYFYEDGTLRGTIGDLNESRDITLEPI